MSIKSEVNDAKVNNVSYPCLKKSKTGKVVVLFTDKGMGFVVGNPTTLSPCGFYSVDWIESSFEIFNGSVTLSNGE